MIFIYQSKKVIHFNQNEQPRFNSELSNHLVSNLSGPKPRKIETKWFDHPELKLSGFSHSELSLLGFTL